MRFWSPATLATASAADDVGTSKMASALLRSYNSCALALARDHLRICERSDDRALREQIVAVGGPRRKAQVLLDEPHRQPVAPRIPEHLAKRADEPRREPLGRRVEEQQARAHAQGARD